MTLNLNTLFVPPLTALTAATATSSDGTILYGSTNEGTSNPLFPHLGVRFDTVGATSLFIPKVSSSDTQNPVAERGSSATGSVAVGSSYSTAADHKAYRYVHDSGVAAAIPPLTGGTFNDALAVSPDGNLVLVTGNSGENPNGEAYLYRAGTGVIAPLGSPNTAWGPDSRLCAPSNCLNTTRSGGLTADGSVVVISFGGADGMSGYFRNAHGWFHLASALAANGVDFAADGWDTEKGLRIHGISSDGTLVFGAGVRYGNIEGFVAEFGAGVLAQFNPQATPPLSTALVGVWTFVENPGDPAPTDPDHVVVFTADGVYYHIERNASSVLSGFERGYYTFVDNRVAITTLLDTNGSTGLSDTNGSSFSITINGDTLIADGQVQAYRITGSPGSIVGGWTLGNPTQPDNSVVLVFTSGGKYFFAQDGSGTGSSRDSIEIGTFTWDAGSGLLVPDVSAGVDQNGGGGLAAPGLTYRANLTGNALGLVLAAGSEVVQFSRVIDPATIPVITSALSASGVAGQAFSYTISATNAVTFGATGLPDGLSIEASTGEISGTPIVGGQFAATISATNAAGVSDIETLTLTIAILTPIGQNVVVDLTNPLPSSPAVTISFATVSSAGTTALAITTAAPPVPIGFSLGTPPIFYELSTTAAFTSAVVCIDYSAQAFAPADTLLLLHYEGGQWIDVTTFLDVQSHTICGAVTSFSPFAVVGATALVGRMHGEGRIDAGGAEYRFAFHISERRIGRERGELRLTVRMPKIGKKKEPRDAFESTSISAITLWDNPGFRPGRRPRPTADSAVFAGTGKWNGVRGYTFEARAADEGEPGRGRDRFAIAIRDAGGAVVATVNGRLERGNIESDRLNAEHRR